MGERLANRRRLNGNALERRSADGDLGGTMRLGAYPARLAEGSKIASIYGTCEISERHRHRHRYEVNMGFRERLEAAGFSFSGVSPTASCRRRSSSPATRGSLGWSSI